MIIIEKVIYILILILLENNNFYKDIHTIYSPTSYNYIVNKNFKLENEFIPSDLETINLKYACKNKLLRKEAKEAFEALAKDAEKQGYNIIVVSAYRSYDYQKKLYNNYIKDYGFYYAQLCSAKAGHSEHQTGLAIDVSDKTLDYDNFEKTKEFEWMMKNAHKYGFILRYPKAKFHITGFKYEPWHYRYVRVEVATYIHENNITLEEYKKNR